MIPLTKQPPLAERLATKEDLDVLKASLNEHFDKIERDLAQIKFGCAVVLGLLVKIAFF